MDAHEIINNSRILESKYQVWKTRNYDLEFYFQNIFDTALSVLRSKLEGGDIQLKKGDDSVYKALFVPVGFSLENVALVSALFHPLRLVWATSDKATSVNRKTLPFLEAKIRQYCPDTKIDRLPSVSSTDHHHVERSIVEWAEKMKSSGFSVSELAIDLTGGTKPMSIGAQNAAMSLGITAFYLSVTYDEDGQAAIPGTESLMKMPRKQAQTNENMVFVIMPFKPEYDLVYAAIETAVARTRRQCVRLDREKFQGCIVDKIIESLSAAGTIIAEVSSHNANVYYELGYAHAWGKKVIMLNHDIEKAPFDVRHLNMVRYDIADTLGLADKLVDELAP